MNNHTAGSPEAGKIAMAELARAINQAHGTELAAPLSLLGSADIKRMPFGIYSLDYALRGGIPLGHTTRIWGQKSTLKSTLCIRAICSAQNTCRKCRDPIIIDPNTGEMDCSCPSERWDIDERDHFGLLTAEQQASIVKGELPPDARANKARDSASLVVRKDQVPLSRAFGGNVKTLKVGFHRVNRCEPMRSLYFDNEGTVDGKWAKKNGTNLDLVTRVTPDHGEQTLDLLDFALQTGDVDFIVIDSISMMTPKDFLEKTAGEATRVAAQANLLKRLTHKITHHRNRRGILSAHQPTILMTSQVNTQGIGSYRTYLGPSNGNQIEHLVSVDVQMKAKELKMKTDEVALYGRFEFVVKKQKTEVGVGSTGEIIFHLIDTKDYKVGDTMDEKAVLKAARSLGLLTEGSGAQSYGFQSKFASEEDDYYYYFKTLKELLLFLRNNPTVYREFRGCVFQAKMKHEEIGDVEEEQQSKPSK